MGTLGALWMARSTELPDLRVEPRGTRLAFPRLWEGGLRPIVVTFRVLVCPALLLLLAGDAGLVSQAWAQTTPPPTPPPSAATASAAGELPVDLSRIRDGLQQPVTALKFADGRLRFFAQTEEKAVSFEALTFGFNLFHGPVPGAGMTHQEFLNQVTPKYLNSSGGIRAIESLEWGLVNYAAVWTIKRLYKELSEAKTSLRKKQIQDQIDRELAALKGGK